MNAEPQPIISTTARHDHIEVAILAGSPGPAGPAGPAGANGADGSSVGVFQGNAAPTADREGDLWIKPVTLPDGSAGVQLHVWNGSAWFPIGEGSGGGGLQPGQPGEFFNLLVGLRDNATVLPFDEGDIAANGAITAVGSIQTLTGLSTPVIVYGPNASSPGRAAGKYELPYPEQTGYLRADAGDSDGWYFAEPVIVSDIEPPAPAGGGAIWIDPTGDAPAGGSTDAFTSAEPITYADDPVETVGGEPLAEIVPSIVAAVRVIVGGRRYLLPLIEE